MKRNQAKKMFEIIVEKEGLEFLDGEKFRSIPEVLGQKADDCMPCIMQGICQRVRRMWKRDLPLTASCMLQDVCLNSQ